jgi:hypothetical protein
VAVLKRGCRALEVVWLRMATRILHDELPGGIVYYVPHQAATPELRDEMTAHKTSVELSLGCAMSDKKIIPQKAE